MSRYLIDKHGEVLPAFDDRLTEKFGYPLPDFDLPSYAVRNLGAVDLDIESQRTIVRFRWLTVTDAALETTAQLLLSSLGPVTIHHETESWQEAAFGSPNEAAEWLTANRPLARGGAAYNIAVSALKLQTLANRPLARLEEHEDRLALVFKKWRLSQGVFGPDIATFFFRFGLLDRSIVASEQESDHRLVFEHVGPGFHLYENSDKTWTLRAQGQPVSEQLDSNYGRWVERNYAHVLEERQPRFEYIDAVIQPRGGDAYRWGYDRLLLPWRTTNGTRVVTNTSYNRHSSRVA